MSIKKYSPNPPRPLVSPFCPYPPVSKTVSPLIPKMRKNTNKVHRDKYKKRF